MPCSRSRSATSSARPASGTLLKIGSMAQQGIAGEEHLRDEPLGVGVAEEREVDVGRPPREGVVLPRVRAGLDRHEAIATLVIREHLALAEEVGIERRVVVVHWMRILARGVRLPHLDERAAHRPAAVVEHAADQHHLLAERRALAPGRQIGLAVLHELLGERRRRGLERTRRHPHQRLGRRAQPRALVVGVQVRRVRRPRRGSRPSASPSQRLELPRP